MAAAASSPSARAGVNSQGKSARSNSMRRKVVGLEVAGFGRGSVRTTWFASMPTTSAGPRSRTVRRQRRIVDLQAQSTRRPPRPARAQRVDSGDGACGALPHPRKEAQVGCGHGMVFLTQFDFAGWNHLPAGAAAIESFSAAGTRSSVRTLGSTVGGRAVPFGTIVPLRLGETSPPRGRRLVAETRPAHAAHRCARGRPALREHLQLRTFNVYGAGAALAGRGRGHAVQRDRHVHGTRAVPE